MSEILNKINALEEVYTKEITENRVTHKRLTEKETALDAVEDRQKATDLEFIEREKQIIPSERLIAREQACDKKEITAKEAQAQAIRMAESSNAIIKSERKEMDGLRSEINAEKKDLAQREKDFEDRSKHFKAKIIAEIDKGKL